MSSNELYYLRKIKIQKYTIILIQGIILISFLLLWEILSNNNIINSFIFSSPSKIIETILNLIKTNNYFIHIITTLKEIFISFSLGIIISFFYSIILYEFPIFYKINEPFLTIINSLPKVALGPLIIIIAGANTKSIIIMALLINVINSIMTFYNGFINTDPYKIKMLKSFKANKLQILTKLIIPSSYPTIISNLKLCLSSTLIGVIMGEFLVSKNGIGYLIIYGTQVFNLSLVISGITTLLIISFLLYKIITYIEKKLLN